MDKFARFLQILASRFAAPQAGATGPGNQLAFTIELQEQTFWCWAASSVSVNHYFDKSSTWKQCEVVNQCLGLGTCCIAGNSNQCNTWGYLDRALEAVHNFDSKDSHRASLDEVSAEVDAGRPLCVHIEWRDGTGHFAVIDGYAGDTIHVADPYWNTATIGYDDFPRRYHGGGAWTHTYRVRR